MIDSKDLFVWLDMEMTGLDPDTCVPLEAAMVLTGPDLEEIACVELTIWQPESALLAMEPVVRKMHTENGLLDKVRSSDVGLGEAQKKLAQFLAKHVKLGEGVLAGNSIHQDRRFIARYFPVIDGYLHYRMIDISTIKELVRRWYGQSALYSKATSSHTALSDIRASILELKHYRKIAFK